MKKIITTEIYHDGEFYCAKCIDFDVFTQGKTLDDLVKNIKEAIILHLEDEPLDLKGYDPLIPSPLPGLLSSEM